MANENKLVTLEDLGEAYTALYNRDVMTAADKTKLDGIAAGAQVNTVTGVKGAAESDYRVGDVSLDAEDIGAVPKSDLTSIIATGTTNATGAAIAAGTYFYLNGALVQAKTNIASGATFTSGTNYEDVTAGGLNSLNDQVANFVKSYPSFYGTYPNGKLYNRDCFRLTVPCWNPEKKSITINNAYVYQSDGYFADIKSNVSVIDIERSAFICEITFNTNYAGRLLWIENTIS